MDGQRFEPYGGRRRYRSWMHEPNGVPPRSTEARLRRRAAEENEVFPDLPPGPLDNPNSPPPTFVFLDPVHRGQVESDEENAEQMQPDSPASQFVENNGGNESDPGSLHNEVSSSSESSEGEEDSASESENGSEDEEENNTGPRRFPDLEEPLFPGGDCSKFECLLMIINYSLRHGLSQVATQDLCILVNTILRGEYLPTSKYMLRKIFGKTGFILNFYCRQCENFLVAKKSHEKMFGVYECEVCSLECNLANMNDNHFFVTFSVKQQLRFLLETTENSAELLEYRFTRNPSHNAVSDIFDGKAYSTLSVEGGFLSNRSNISLTINTDGAQVFESSQNTLWPLFFRINEFPPTIRFNLSNCLLGGLWFAKNEPNMHLFMSSFVRELDDLHENGFSWKAPTGQIMRSKVIVLQCVADSKAKPLVQNCKTHNGYYGCGFCLHPGVMYEGSNQAKYPLNDDLILMVDNSFSYTVDAFDPVTKEEKKFAIEDRENERLRQDMELAEMNRNARGEGDIQGVKGKSILMNLPYLDLVFSFPVEYLHCCLLGTARTVAGYWFDSSNHDSMFYAGLRIDTVNKRLLSIRPPVTISRRPRKMSDRKKWHGNEWRNWLLYYSLPCMEGLIPSRYLKHHCLLVSAIYLLLQDKISQDDIERATRYLGIYCKDFSGLYGDSYMYFNIHLLLHLGKCVSLHGPLFCFSAFSFEGANGYLVNLVKGTRGVLNQIAHKYNICKMMPRAVEMYHVNEATLKYCADIMSIKPVQIAYRYNHITALGEQKHILLSEEEVEALMTSGHNVTSSSFERMIIQNVMYHARCYRRKGEKSDSSVVKLKSGRFGVIERIIDPSNFRGPGEPNVLILLRNIDILPRDQVVLHPSGARAEHILKCAPVVYGDLQVITADKIFRLAILIDCGQRSYVTTFPNMYEKD